MRGIAILIVLVPMIFTAGTSEPFFGTTPEISFSNDIQRILSANCNFEGRHGGSAHGEGEFHLDTYESVMALVSYGDARDSKIYQVITRRLNDYTDRAYYNSLGIGLEIETGEHVFQMHFTNSLGLVDNLFLPFTDSKWGNAGVRLGFNISRVFNLCTGDNYL